MFKKALSIGLALLIAMSICSCAAKRTEQAGAGEGIATAASEAAGDTATTLAETDAQPKQEESVSGKEKSQNTSVSQSEKTSAAAAEDEKRLDESAGKNAKQGAGKQKTNTSKKTTTTGKQTTAKQPDDAEKKTISVTLTINCAQAVGKVDGVPDSGYFLSGTQVQAEQEATVYAVLCKACEANGISLTATRTMYGMYVSAIGGLAEKEAGKYSGWTYTVNGDYPPKACDKITLSDGDVIQFIYKAG